MKGLTKSDKTYIFLVLLMFLGKVVWRSFNLDHPLIQRSMNTWAIMFLASALGFVALRIAKRTGFPDIWEEGISTKQRFIIPVFTGLAFAAVEIIIGIIMQMPKNMHVDFPLSIPVYLSVGILSEIIFHLIPIVFLLWLISNVILKGRGQNQVFWILAFLISLWEPILQTIMTYKMGIVTDITFSAIILVFGFAGNMIPVSFFRKYGFLTVIIWRLTDYLIWHIIWPIIGY
ncbi:hypothetical protein [Phosphitispora sp. TUW77]|uniref:hypothetical protein n=1 Tax=Phosphitispora sp. TUW77 TaxID=3152361 RepID=UPI003AB28D70